MSAVESIFKIPELTRRLYFTFIMLAIYRLGIFVPTPGVDAERLKALFQSGGSGANNLFGMLNMFTGGALQNFSVFALGIMPYITVSIIIQLLAAIYKPLEELQKEGPEGKRVLTRYTRIGTVVLALFQGYMLAITLQSQGIAASTGIEFCIITAITLCAGTCFLMWLGEQISENGLGNGISILIAAGIVANMPATLLLTLQLSADTGEPSPAALLGMIALALVIVAFIVFVERAQRRIPVQYPRRSMGRQVTQATTQHMPIKLNMSGVMPAIFASTLLSFPLIIAQASNIELLNQYMIYMTPPHFAYEATFAILVIFFSYFYAAIVFDPTKVSENLKKSGGYVLGVRPGRETAEFFQTVISRLTIWGALYVCVVCIVPNIFYRRLGAESFAAFFGGTAVLIVVSVMMDTISQIQSYAVTRNYDRFMAKGPGKVHGTHGGINIRGQLIKR